METSGSPARIIIDGSMEDFGEGALPVQWESEPIEITVKIGNPRCGCEGWKQSAAQIESAQLLSALHGMPYEGDEFRYCPWCAKRLEVKEKIRG